MKRFILLLLLFCPFNSAYAAGITYTSDTVIDLSDPDINVEIAAGSFASSVQISSGTIRVTLANEDYITFSVANYTMNVSGDSRKNYRCNNGIHSVELSKAGTSTISFTKKNCNNFVGGGTLNSYLTSYVKEVAKEKGNPGSHISERPPTGTFFKDMKNHIAHDAVRTLWERGVVHGKTPQMFYPDDSLTRAEIVKIALNTFEYKITKKASILDQYRDIDQNNWYAEYISTATDFGIVQGYDDGTFRPNTYVNRAEALKILVIASGKELTNTESSPFTDVKENEWYKKYIDYAYQKEIVKGRTPEKFEPLDSISRGEMALIAVRAL